MAAEVIIYNYDPTVFDSKGTEVGKFKNVKGAAEALNCDLVKPSLGRFTAWCRAHGYILATAEPKTNPDTVDDGSQGTADDGSSTDDQGQADDANGNNDDDSADGAGSGAAGGSGGDDGQKDDSKDDGNGAPDEPEGAQEPDSDGNPDEDSDDDQGEPDSNTNAGNEPPENDPDDPFVKESRLTQVRNEIEEDMHVAFQQHKDYVEGLKDKIELAKSGAGVDIEKMKEALTGILTKKLKEFEKWMPNVVEIKKGRSTKKIKGEHKMFHKLMASIATEEPAMLVGPAGSGKTLACQHAAEQLEMQFYPQSVGAQTTQAHLLGFIDANGKYHPTAFRLAFENGGIFLLDEVDAGNANVLTILNAALSNGYMSFPDGIIQRHEDFRCVAAANTFGNGQDRQYVGRNQLDAATLDRFNVIDWNYDERLELDFSIDTEWTQTVQKWRKGVHDLKLRHIVSPRASLKGAKLLEAGLSMTDVMDMVIFKGLSPADKRRLKEKVKGANNVPSDDVKVKDQVESLI